LWRKALPLSTAIVIWVHLLKELVYPKRVSYIGKHPTIFATFSWSNILGEHLADVTSDCLPLITSDMYNATERRKSFTACRDRNRLLLHEIIENGFYYCAATKQYVQL
jgi:hypothetical protein